MVWTKKDYDKIPGTYVFDGRRSAMGWGLNKMCMSFNEAANREEFLRDEDAYCDRFGVSNDQKAAVRERDVLQMLKLGGNIYYLAKFAGVFGLNMQDIGAQQTGVTLEEFKAKLVAAGED